MARGAAETHEPGVRSQFVKRFANLPIVHKAWDYASNTYSSLKGSSRLVNYTLTTAEKSLYFVVEQTKPVVRRFEKQIQAVDNFVCDGLSSLEATAPIITKPPEEVVPSALDTVKSLIFTLVLWPLAVPRLLRWAVTLPQDALRASAYVALTTADRLLTWAEKTATKAGGAKVDSYNIVFYFGIGLTTTCFERVRDGVLRAVGVLLVAPRVLIMDIVRMMGCLKPSVQNGDVYSKQVVTASGELVANHEE